MPTPDLADELDALPHLSTGELLARYAELFGQPARTRNKAFLVRKSLGGSRPGPRAT